MATVFSLSIVCLKIAQCQRLLVDAAIVIDFRVQRHAPARLILIFRKKISSIDVTEKSMMLPVIHLLSVSRNNAPEVAVLSPGDSV